jgi:hypothetical protein
VQRGYLHVLFVCMNRPVVDSVKHLPPGAISAEKGENCCGRSGSIFRLLLELEAGLRKQRREESKIASGRRQIFQADRNR